MTDRMQDSWTIEVKWDDPSTGNYLAHIKLTNGRFVASTADRDYARMIAAAPDLLEALLMIRNNWGGHSEVCEFILRRNNHKCNCGWPKIATQCDRAILKVTKATGDE